MCPPATSDELNLLIINNGRAQVNFTKGSKGRKGAAVLGRRGKGSAFLEKTTHELQDETIFIIFAELKRFHKSEEECETALDKLLYLFKNIGEMEDDER